MTEEYFNGQRDAENNLQKCPEIAYLVFSEMVIRQSSPQPPLATTYDQGFKDYITKIFLKKQRESLAL